MQPPKTLQECFDLVERTLSICHVESKTVEAINIECSMDKWFEIATDAHIPDQAQIEMAAIGVATAQLEDGGEFTDDASKIIRFEIKEDCKFSLTITGKGGKHVGEENL